MKKISKVIFYLFFIFHSVCALFVSILHWHCGYLFHSLPFRHFYFILLCTKAHKQRKRIHSRNSCCFKEGFFFMNSMFEYVCYLHRWNKKEKWRKKKFITIDFYVYWCCPNSLRHMKKTREKKTWSLFAFQNVSFFFLCEVVCCPSV